MVQLGMRITGLDHVQLAMPAGGEAAARAFYAEVLGLTEVVKPEALRGRGGCWFAGPGVALHLGVEDGFAPARKAHPALRVADLDAAAAALEAAACIAKRDASVPEVRRLYTADPFGNRIELIQDGDQFPTA